MENYPFSRNLNSFKKHLFIDVSSPVSIMLTKSFLSDGDDEHEIDDGVGILRRSATVNKIHSSLPSNMYDSGDPHNNDNNE